MKPRDKQFEGKLVAVKGQELLIPALSFGDIEKLATKLDLLEQPQESITGEFVGAVIDVFYAAISRNYDCSRDEAAALIDLRNFRTITDAIKGVSGLDPVEGEPAGETAPVA